MKKKILMFGPAFFGYRESIADELRAMGAEVDLYDERPNNGAFCKTMLRYNVPFYRPAVTKYYRSIIRKNCDKDYDYVFVIKSEAINTQIFVELKAAYPNARFILYLWDSVDNVPDGQKKIRLYDRVLTFDPQDAKAYGLILRPLFFGKDYAGASEKRSSYRYDMAFVGTAHSIRPFVVNRIAEDCRRRNRSCYSYLFLPHPIVYIYNKVFNPAYREVAKADIHFDPIPAATIRQVYDDSACILDVEHNAQRGLTMRTIEMVGMGKKLITTNRQITEYDFFNPANICVIDRKEPQVPAEFWGQDYIPVPPGILHRYSLRAFVCEIFDIKEQDHEQ